MAVTFHIPAPLRSYADGRSQVEIDAPSATLADALQALWVVCPGVRDRVVTEQGQIREHINVFVSQEDIRYTGGLATRMPPGAEISIVPAISGGNGPQPASDSTAESTGDDSGLFRDAVKGLLDGDFSRLEPLFMEQPGGGHPKCRIREWYEKGYFDREREALEEALTCACFLGRTSLADFLMNQGVELTAGFRTGMNGFHWAADRGQLETVRMLIGRKAPLEIRNMYGGTVLGFAVWSALQKLRPNHLAIIEALIKAGAQLEAAGYPTGNERVDKLLCRLGAGA